MKLGEVCQLGPHRLMCGDAGNRKHVEKLFKDSPAPDLIFTSPPYGNQRTYFPACKSWDTIMRRAFSGIPHHPTTQIIVNLGLIHRQGLCLFYWTDWLRWMHRTGWKHYGISVWDKLDGFPVMPQHGRLYPSFEFLFQLHKNPIEPQRSVLSKHAGERLHGNGVRLKTDQFRKKHNHGVPVKKMRIADNVFRIFPDRGNKSNHPATFPVHLPAAIFSAYSKLQALTFDPFAGSGTSIIAAHRTGRISYCMEISPQYCTAAVKRIEAEMAGTKTVAKRRSQTAAPASTQTRLFA